MIKKSVVTALFIILTITGVAKQNSDTPVIALLERYAPDVIKRFVFEIEDPQSDKDFFSISSNRNRVYINGNNNSSLASGLHFYLKNIIGVSLTSNNMKLTLPKQLPDITKPIRKESEIKTRLYFNGDSYKSDRTYWGNKEWQQEIDRMALLGVNMAYIPVGIGAIYHNTLLEMGLTNNEIASFLPMPSYYSWWADGEHKGDSHQLPQSWYDGEENLLKFIISELKKWDIEVVAQGYDGVNLPSSLSKEEFAKRYYSQVAKLYDNTLNIKLSTQTGAILLRANNPNAVWLYDISSKKASAQEIAALNRGNVLLIGKYNDLLSWDKNNISGHHNFILRPTPEEAQENLYNRLYRNRLMFCGIELIDNDNYRINSNFVNSYIWDKSISYKDYIKIYLKQVYGKENPTIERAIEVMYNISISTERPFIYSEPKLPKTAPNLSKTEEYILALKDFASEASKYANNANYQHDLIIFTQTALYRRSQELASRMAHSVDTRSGDFFRKESDKFLALILMLDKLYYTRPEFRYDKYLDMARSKGTTHQEQGVYEGDVRRYTTIWGDRYTSNMLQKNDICYSPKSGILGDYYYNRWYLYIRSLDGIVNNRIEGDIDFYTIGKDWSEQRNTFGEQPKSSPLLRAVEIINYLNASI